MIRLQTLGSLDLRAADGAVLHPVLRQSKRSALLAYLAIERPGQFHRRDQLLGLFWPEADLKGARGSLSQAIHFLRQNLGKDAIINRGDEEIALNRDLVWCDAAAFQAHVAADEYEQAIDLYAGDLLPGVFVDEAEGFEQWLEQKRDTLKRQAKEACVALADRAEQEGRFDDVANWLRRAIKYFPYDESLHRRLIIALDGAGDRAAALRAYDELVQTLRTEFDAEPSAETTELIIQVRSRTEAQVIPLPPRPVYALGGNTPGVERRALLPMRKKRNLLTAVAIGVLAVAGMLWSSLSDREPVEPEAPINRIAVLFFNDVSPQRNLGYLAEGLTTSLIDHLGQVNQIEVISQNGVRPFRGDSISLDSIARTLDVGTIVGGNISESNGILRVNVQLVKGSSGIVAQSKMFQRPTGELFALLDDVASEVGSFLRASVGNEIRMQRYRAETESVEAWRAVQRAEELLAEGKSVGDRGDPQSAAALFTRADSLLGEAAQLDRRWAEPLVVRARLAENEAWLFTYGGRGTPSEHLKRALAAANEAVERNSRSAAAYEARGRVRYVQWLMAPPPKGADQLLQQAESDLTQAITLDANRARAHSTLSLVYESQGRFAEARRSAQSALDADAYLEDAFQIVVRLFNTSFELKDDEEAGRWCDEMRRRLPTNWPSAHCDLLLLGWRDDVNADARKALYILETFGAGDSPDMRKSMLPRLTVLAAATVARAGDVEQAEQMVASARATAEENDLEMLYLEAAYRVRVGQLDQGRALLNEYVQKNPNARVRAENGRFFEPLRTMHAAARNTP